MKDKDSSYLDHEVPRVFGMQDISFLGVDTRKTNRDETCRTPILVTPPVNSLETFLKDFVIELNRQQTLESIKIVINVYIYKFLHGTVDDKQQRC